MARRSRIDRNGKLESSKFEGRDEEEEEHATKQNRIACRRSLDRFPSAAFCPPLPRGYEKKEGRVGGRVDSDKIFRRARG